MFWAVGFACLCLWGVCFVSAGVVGGLPPISAGSLPEFLPLLLVVVFVPSRSFEKMRSKINKRVQRLSKLCDWYLWQGLKELTCRSSWLESWT